MDFAKLFDLLKSYLSLIVKFLSEVLGADFGKIDDAIENATLPENL